MALSDLFIDNEISYEGIAERVAHLPISEVERILFYEVAPVFMSNLLTLKANNHKGFSEEYVISSINRHLLKLQKSWLYRKKVAAKIKFYRFCLKQDWYKLVAELCQLQTEK
ncbi:hypothetical protein M0N77_07090 [Psychrobacter sp. AH5]|uniref:DUF7079 family protein n=1 Tax=Psychrobacter sp. AH5 TaxID=2937433 RepID=UPI0033429BDF